MEQYVRRWRFWSVWQADEYVLIDTSGFAAQRHVQLVPFLGSLGGTPILGCSLRGCVVHFIYGDHSQVV